MAVPSSVGLCRNVHRRDIFENDKWFHYPHSHRSAGKSRPLPWTHWLLSTLPDTWDDIINTLFATELIPHTHTHPSGSALYGGVGDCYVLFAISVYVYQATPAPRTPVGLVPAQEDFTIRVLVGCDRYLYGCWFVYRVDFRCHGCLAELRHPAGVVLGSIQPCLLYPRRVSLTGEY